MKVSECAEMMYFCNSCKFSTSYVFPCFYFFLVRCFFSSSRNFLKSSCLLIKFFCFITLPNFSSGC
eukprot:UN01825